jgi:hypothetical protein
LTSAVCRVIWIDGPGWSFLESQTPPLSILESARCVGIAKFAFDSALTWGMLYEPAQGPWERAALRGGRERSGVAERV